MTANLAYVIQHYGGLPDDPFGRVPEVRTASALRTYYGKHIATARQFGATEVIFDSLGGRANNAAGQAVPCRNFRQFIDDHLWAETCAVAATLRSSGVRISLYMGLHFLMFYTPGDQSAKWQLSPIYDSFGAATNDLLASLRGLGPVNFIFDYSEPLSISTKIPLRWVTATVARYLGQSMKVETEGIACAPDPSGNLGVDPYTQYMLQTDIPDPLLPKLTVGGVALMHTWRDRFSRWNKQGAADFVPVPHGVYRVLGWPTNATSGFNTNIAEIMDWERRGFEFISTSPQQLEWTVTARKQLAQPPSHN